jgi:hypothetical protein
MIDPGMILIAYLAAGLVLWAIHRAIGAIRKTN